MYTFLTTMLWITGIIGTIGWVLSLLTEFDEPFYYIPTIICVIVFIPAMILQVNITSAHQVEIPENAVVVYQAYAGESGTYYEIDGSYYRIMIDENQTEKERHSVGPVKKLQEIPPEDMLDILVHIKSPSMHHLMYMERIAKELGVDLPNYTPTSPIPIT